MPSFPEAFRLARCCKQMQFVKVFLEQVAETAYFQLECLKGCRKVLGEGGFCPIMLNEYVYHSDRVLHREAKEADASKSSVCCFHSFFTFRLIPRKERLWKFLVCKSLFATARGIDSVAILYPIPAQSLNLYAIHPRQAGKCAFLVLLIHHWVLPVTFSSICLESFPSIMDQTPSNFSAVLMSPCDMCALVPSGRGMVISVCG